ncbi:AI-2E family transporter [Motiliproteus sp. SC1-56]|uniref:AI-2E family transporter n=1 Tax=Motiliproteus sp. SC1-56 TaxID=2799565 RepID=UPI001A8E9615|nr:AI-2E family transporter [Motiliproteus sp. SC1-56]
MFKVISSWIERYFSDEEALLLFVFLAAALVIILTLGGTLAPVFAGMILSFLMQGVVGKLEQFGMGHNLAVTLVFLAFVGGLMALLLVVVPQVWGQLVNLLNELPGMVAEGQELLLLLPQRYPDLISEVQVRSLISQVGSELGKLGQVVVSYSLSSIANLVQVLIYLVLVPILVFFFLKDGGLIMRWWTSFLPERRAVMSQVWTEMDTQIANYVRGKVVEIIVVGAVSYVVFIALGLNYAALLGLMVGLSVVIPYIGAAVVTLPVAVIAFFQWGWSNEFMYLMAAYAIIQALDGNVLVPLLFSEAVNLHPVAIIVAVLVFGGLWGFWGVFFAIPLATLLKAVMTAWPRAGSGAGAAIEEAG